MRAAEIGTHPLQKRQGKLGNGDDLKKISGVFAYLNRDAAQLFVVGSHVKEDFRKTHFGGWWFRFRRI